MVKKNLEKKDIKKFLDNNINKVKEKIEKIDTKDIVKNINNEIDTVKEKTKKFNGKIKKASETIKINKLNNKKFYIFLLVLLALFAMAIYVKTKFEISENEKNFLDERKKEKELKDKVKLDLERTKKESGENIQVMKYPYINLKGLVRFKEFSMEKDKLKAMVKDDSETNNTLNNVILTEIYKKVFENSDIRYSFDKIISENSQIDDSEIINLYLKSNGLKEDFERDKKLFEILGKAAFQFSRIGGLKVYVDGKIPDMCYLDYAFFCNDNISYFMLKNNNFEENLTKKNNSIFDIKNGDEIDAKDIRIKGVIFADSVEFLPFDEFVGEAKFYNSDNIFLGNIQIKNISNKNALLNNKEILKEYRIKKKIKKEKEDKKKEKERKDELKEINNNFDIKNPKICLKAVSKCDICLKKDLDKGFICEKKKVKKKCVDEKYTCEEIKYNGKTEKEINKKIEEKKEEIEKSLLKIKDNCEFEKETCEKIVLKAQNDLEIWPLKSVNSISVLGNGAIADPRTKDGYVVIESYDDRHMNKTKLRFEIKFK